VFCLLKGLVNFRCDAESVFTSYVWIELRWVVTFCAADIFEGYVSVLT